MSKISVIIPCFNHARYLGEAIESALAQTPRPAEILVVDDGSTDNTVEVARRYDAPVRYLRQDNRGLSAARNTGIRQAQGDYLAFLDADDLWLPGCLAALAPILNNNPKLGAVYGTCRFVDERGAFLPQSTQRVIPTERLRDTLIDGDVFPAHAVLIRKSCFDQVGLFDENLRANEDWDMWLRVSAQFAIAGTAEPVALYRMHGSNMSQDPQRMHESQVAVVRKHFGPAEGDPSTWPPERQRAYATVYLWRALAHYQRQEPAAGQDYVVQALSTSPALANNLDAFYALACADQPLGYMGDLEHLKLERNAGWLASALAATFDRPGVTAWLRARRRRAYGSAYLALGLLAYGSRRLGLARRWLTLAAWQRPDVLLSRQWATTVAKSFLSPRILAWRRRWVNDRHVTSGN